MYSGISDLIEKVTNWTRRNPVANSASIDVFLIAMSVLRFCKFCKRMLMQNSMNAAINVFILFKFDKDLKISGLLCQVQEHFCYVVIKTVNSDLNHFIRYF